MIQLDLTGVIYKTINRTKIFFRTSIRIITYKFKEKKSKFEIKNNKNFRDFLREEFFYVQIFLNFNTNAILLNSLSYSREKDRNRNILDRFWPGR